MPIPDLTPAGYLPEGIHQTDRDEVYHAFVEGKSQRRQDIWDGMNKFLTDFQGVVTSQAIYFDGSFITSKIDPGDIDLVIEIDPLEWGTFYTQIQSSHDSIKANYHVDVWPYFRGAQHDLRRFFQYLRIEEKNSKGLSPDACKGILLVQGVSL